jgi:hypothetical protein
MPHYAEANSDINGAVQQQGRATAGVRFNNQNWFTTPHPEPETFFVTEKGEVYGTTTTGIPFTQTNFIATSSPDVRVQKFTIQDHSHYIVDSQIAYSLEELDVKIAELHQESAGLWARITQKVD